MTPAEFAIVLTGLLLPALILGTIVLVVAQRKEPRSTPARLFQAWIILVALSAVIALGMGVLDLGAIGHYLGVRDEPFMWAPFAFVAVALALPFSIVWARRRR